MDKMIYIAMTGAKQVMNAQSTIANNLANASTTGFRADFDAFRALHVQGTTLPTRSFVAETTVGHDFTPGAIQTTGRDLDAAINGKGWFVVQTPDGNEAYTRDGNFQLDQTGQLKTTSGFAVLGETSQPVTIPPAGRVQFAPDGSIMINPAENQDQTQVIGRLRLVNPDEKLLFKGSDGLFRQKDGQTPQAAQTVKVAGGSLEGSNVNAVDGMIKMISSSRMYDTHMKLLQNAQTNDRQAGQILSM